MPRTVLNATLMRFVARDGMRKVGGIKRGFRVTLHGTAGVGKEGFGV